MLAVVSAITLALAGGAQAQETAAAAPKAEVAASTELKPGERKVKVVCKKRAAAGTRFAKTTCMEIEAYKAQQEEDRRAFEAVQNRTMVSIAKGN